MDRPPPSKTPAPSGPGGGRLGDRLGQLAQRGARRTRASWILYGVLGVTVLVIFAGQLLGWWQAPSERKILEDVERRRAAQPAPAPGTGAPAPVPAPGGAPVPPR